MLMRGGADGLLELQGLQEKYVPEALRLIAGLPHAGTGPYMMQR
jgi:hypothetical protein